MPEKNHYLIHLLKFPVLVGEVLLAEKKRYFLKKFMKGLKLSKKFLKVCTFLLSFFEKLVIITMIMKAYKICFSICAWFKSFVFPSKCSVIFD